MDYIDVKEKVRVYIKVGVSVTGERCSGYPEILYIHYTYSITKETARLI